MSDKAMSEKVTIDSSDPEVIAICSMLCFQCGPIAEILRMGGHAIDRKAEDEQGKVIVWLLGRYQYYGAGWRASCDEELRAIRAEARKAQG